MTLEQRIKRARISREALQNSTMRIQDKVREAKTAVEPSVMLTRPVPKSIPEVKVRPSQGMHRTITGDTTYSSSAVSSRGSGSGSSGGLGSTGIDDQRKHDLYKPAIEFAAKSIAAGNYKRAKELLSNIPESERAVKVYLLFIQLARKQSPAETPLLSEKACWECIIELQPLALEAYVHLLRLQMALPILLNTIPADCIDKPWMKSYLQGMDHFFHMRYKAALAEFRALDMKYPQNVDIKLKVALCYRWLVKRTDSCRMFAQIRRIDPYVVDDMYHYAAVLLDLEKEQEVSELSQHLLATNDKHPDTWCVLAFNWEHKGQREKALQMVNRALELRPVHSGSLQIKGFIYLSSAPLKALQFFRDAYNVEKNMATYTGLVECYMMLERYAEAISACKELRRLVPDSAHALAMLGNAMSHSRDHATHTAEEIFREALRIDPACLEASDGLCMILGSQFRNVEALELLDKQIDYNRVDEAHVKKARVYMGLEQWRQALLNYQQALL
ncbi:Anaphase-promoting complex subunit 7 [Podila minutissima]|uniref:Anaphase-promoting complex subunit 7 n=1 Tax=Podila minutissima TaxID=64525 RepID=A0A9P5SQR2_9FUNG|nr:Anaphase-promoting complex subunit 7 [Podila minutissima]